MEKKFEGKVWKLSDDIDTDTIIAGRHGVILDKKEMASHCLETLRPEFTSEVKPGDILVAGKNFGCGSSREMAAEAINVNGVYCIIAKSFARIFFRNAINNGLLLIEQPDLYDDIKEGDTITVHMNKHVDYNGKEYPIAALPENLMRIIQDGGLVGAMRKLNGLD